MEPTGVDLVNNLWIFIAAVLVIFMQAGFMLVEAGLTRGKNVANICMKNMMDFCMGAIAFFAVGYAFMYGSGGIIGTEMFFLSGVDLAAFPGDGGLLPGVDFFFQLAFAAAAATIVSGAVAERTKFIGYMLYSLAITAFIYPVFGHWTWGGGWLADMGFHDFAGSTIVHSTGGWAALAGAMLIGPRIGKYGPDGKPRAIPGHSIPFAIVGVVVLLIGWYGFNPGSELAFDGAVPGIAITTTLSAAAGGLVAMIITWILGGKPDVAMTGNGVLAGLVGITAGCAWVDPWAAIVIGSIAGALVYFSVLFFDRIKIDDPVGAVSVHGVCGAFGSLAVGLFASEGLIGSSDYGLLLGGGAGLLMDQIVGIVVNFLWVFGLAFALFFALKSMNMLRVSEEEELEGLDIAEHGVPGYGEAALA